MTSNTQSNLLAWGNTFDKRLADWSNLRSSADLQSIEQLLLNINRWWFRAPWSPYYLHWADQNSWPDPWQLLHDNIFCDLSRGLGILYTIALIDRVDLQTTKLITTVDNYSLIIYNDQYVLNWDEESIVNNTLDLRCYNCLTQDQVKKYI